MHRGGSDDEDDDDDGRSRGGRGVRRKRPAALRQVMSRMVELHQAHAIVAAPTCISTGWTWWTSPRRVGVLTALDAHAWLGDDPMRLHKEGISDHAPVMVRLSDSWSAGNSSETWWTWAQAALDLRVFRLRSCLRTMASRPLLSKHRLGCPLSGWLYAMATGAAVRSLFTAWGRPATAGFARRRMTLHGGWRCCLSNGSLVPRRPVPEGRGRRWASPQGSKVRAGPIVGSFLLDACI